MRISKWLSPLVALALAGCVGGLGGGADDAFRQVQVTSDLVTITGPTGFCVDPTATQNAGDTGFVLLGNCAAISGSARAAQPDVAAVLTATVSAPSLGASLTENLGALETFFRSSDGRALLSRSGEADSVDILDTRTSGAMFLLHARDDSGGDIAGVSTDYWRAYLDIGPRLATLTVLSLAAANIDDAAALDTLTRFAAAVQETNLGAESAISAADLPQEVTEAVEGPFRTGLFRRIFQ